MHKDEKNEGEGGANENKEGISVRENPPQPTRISNEKTNGAAENDQPGSTWCNLEAYYSSEKNVSPELEPLKHQAPTTTTISQRITRASARKEQEAKEKTAKLMRASGAQNQLLVAFTGVGIVLHGTSSYPASTETYHGRAE